MSTLALTNALASLFVQIGMIGAGLAVVCALVVAVAIARGAAGLAGGAAGVWIVGAMLTLTASFATEWAPLIVAAVALGAALVVGLVARGVLSRVRASAQVHAAVTEAATSAEAKSASRGRGTESVAVIA